MALVNALGGLALNTTADETKQMAETLVHLLVAIHDKMPRLDRTDRLTVDLADYGIGGTPWGVSNVNGNSNPTNGAQYYRLLETWQFSDMGSARLYQNITVT